jgi:hypothetical protein
VRHAAARSVIELSIKSREFAEMEQRVAALEGWPATTTTGRGGGDEPKANVARPGGLPGPDPSAALPPRQGWTGAPAMRLLRRLHRLEGTARSAAAACAAKPFTAVDWLTLFETEGRQGLYAAEPDFPAALAFYREAVERAQARGLLPRPPAARTVTRPPRGRLTERDLELAVGWGWLLEMTRRARQGVPPVTETECAELSAWFGAHAGELERRLQPARWFEMGDGRLLTVGNIWESLSRGPRELGAGLVAEDVRRLRARYGGES